MNSLIECNLILHIYSHWNNTNRQITNKFTTMSQSSVSMGENSNILISFDIMGAHTAHHTHTHIYTVLLRLDCGFLGMDIYCGVFCIHKSVDLKSILRTNKQTNETNGQIPIMFMPMR